LKLLKSQLRILMKGSAVLTDFLEIGLGLLQIDAVLHPILRSSPRFAPISTTGKPAVSGSEF